MRRVRVDTIVLAGVMCAGSPGWGQPAAGAAAYPGHAEPSSLAAPSGLVRPQLRDLILVIRTAEDPIVAEIAYRRAMQVDPHNVHARAAMAQRLAGAQASPAGHPADPVPADPPPGDAQSRPTAPPPPGKATLQRQDAELRARLQALRVQTARVSDSMAVRRDGPRWSGSYYFHGYYPLGPGYYPWPLMYPAVPVVYGGHHFRPHPAVFGRYRGGGWSLAGWYGAGGGIRIWVSVRH